MGEAAEVFNTVNKKVQFESTCNPISPPKYIHVANDIIKFRKKKVHFFFAFLISAFVFFFSIFKRSISSLDLIFS